GIERDRQRVRSVILNAGGARSDPRAGARVDCDAGVRIDKVQPKAGARAGAGEIDRAVGHVQGVEIIIGVAGRHTEWAAIEPEPTDGRPEVAEIADIKLSALHKHITVGWDRIADPERQGASIDSRVAAVRVGTAAERQRAGAGLDQAD